jgi:DnaK suppressor protein
MARREALLRLHRHLKDRRDALLKSLAGELHDLGGNATGISGDIADAAFGSGSHEMASQLAELEARELKQIEVALAKLARGTYGLCDICSKKIPVARLNALPYTIVCIECQRDQESAPGWDGGRGAGNWEKIYDFDASRDDKEVSLSDLEIDVSGR